MSATTIPSYDLARGDALSLPFKFLPLDRSKESYNPSEPHRHNYHEVFYFEQGGGWHDIDFRSFEIEDNSIHFINPGQVHQIRRDPGSHGSILLFTTEFYTLDSHSRDPLSRMWFLTHSLPHPIIRPAPEEQGLFLETVRSIGAEFERNGVHREEILRSYLHIFLLHSLRLFERMQNVPADDDQTHELVNRLRTLVERHFNTIHSPSEYAAMLNVSQNHLNSVVKRKLGKTIGDMVHERIVLEAQRLLFNTDLSVKEIAFRLNYEDPSYFTRFFRNHAGLSPQEFRESARKKHK